MSTAEEPGPLPEVTIAGVVIDIDRIDDEHGTILVFDKTGRRLAEIPNVAKITIGTTWDAVCAHAEK